jgi:PhnB protein
MGLTPIMLVDNAVAAIDFYHRAFGAKEISRLNAPRGEKLMHVRMEIEGSTLVFMDDLADLTPAASHARLPKTLGGTSVTLHLQVADAKSLWEKALQAGAVAVVPLQEMFWGELYGRLRDPFGHEWTIAQFLRSVDQDQIERGAAKAWS